SSEKNKLANIEQRLQLFSRQLLKDRFSELAHLSRIVNMANPTQLLRRGFSITKINGKAITSIEQIQENDDIETWVHDGKINSKVTQKKSTYWKQTIHISTHSTSYNVSLAKSKPARPI